MNTSKTKERYLKQIVGHEAAPSNYKPPSLRSKPRQIRNINNDSTSKTPLYLISDDEEMGIEDCDSDEYQESDQESDHESDHEYKASIPKQRHQQQESSPGLSDIPLRKNQRQPIVIDETTPQATPTIHLGKKRKLRGYSSSFPADIYDDILDEDYDDIDHDLYQGGKTINNGYSSKRTKTSPLVLGSPSRVNKNHRHDTHITVISEDELIKSSPNHTKWKTKHTITPFIDKLKIQLQEDSLDLSQHSIIPKGLVVTNRMDRISTIGSNNDPTALETMSGESQSTSIAVDDDISEAEDTGTNTVIPNETITNTVQETKVGFLQRLTRYLFG